MEIQTRSEDGALSFFSSLEQAFDYAEKTPEVWKVSFNAEDGTRCRFIRRGDGSTKRDGKTVMIPSWIFDPIVILECPNNSSERV